MHRDPVLVIRRTVDLHRDGLTARRTLGPDHVGRVQAPLDGVTRDGARGDVASDVQSPLRLHRNDEGVVEREGEDAVGSGIDDVRSRCHRIRAVEELARLWIRRSDVGLEIELHRAHGDVFRGPGGIEDDVGKGDRRSPGLDGSGCRVRRQRDGEAWCRRTRRSEGRVEVVRPMRQAKRRIGRPRPEEDAGVPGHDAGVGHRDRLDTLERQGERAGYGRRRQLEQGVLRGIRNPCLAEDHLLAVDHFDDAEDARGSDESVERVVALRTLVAKNEPEHRCRVVVRRRELRGRGLLIAHIRQLDRDGSTTDSCCIPQLAVVDE